MSNTDHETNVEKLTELLELKDQRIAELERENARIHELYSLDRAEHDSRGGA